MHSETLVNKENKEIGQVYVDTVNDINGVWVDLDSSDKKTTSSLSIHVDNDENLVISMARNLNKNFNMCDFALVITEKDVVLQGIVNGKQVQIRLSELLQLVEYFGVRE